MSNQVQVKKIDTLKGILDAPSVAKEFERALAKSAPAFVSSIIDLFNGDSNIQLCDPKEVVMEALKAAVLKLPINKSLGFAYIIPFNNSVKTPNGWEKKMTPSFQIGYKGYIQLAMRTGQYRIINADVVFEGEVRSVNKLTGEIAFDGVKTSDDVVGYFCHFELLNGFSKTLYMTTVQMAAHAKRYSKGLKRDVTVEELLVLANQPFDADSKAVGWMGNYHGMSLKTVIRILLSKYGYLSIEMQDAFSTEDEFIPEQSDSIRYSDVEIVAQTEPLEILNQGEPIQQEPKFKL